MVPRLDYGRAYASKPVLPDVREGYSSRFAGEVEDKLSCHNEDKSIVKSQDTRNLFPHTRRETRERDGAETTLH